MDAVQLGARGDWFRLTPDGAVQGPPQYVTAHLCCAGLTASRRIAHHYASGFEDLAEFFGQLANEWRGWTGARVWESVEGDLRIEARHEYRHVQLRIILRSAGPGWGNEGWQATADLTIDPGEELARIASDVRGLALGPCTDADPA